MTQPAQSHFFVSSVADWMTTTDKRTLSDVIKVFEAGKRTYQIFFVPVPHNTEYQLNMYAPQVEGAHLVEVVEFKSGRRVRR